MKKSPKSVKTKKVVIYPDRSFSIGEDFRKMEFNDLVGYLGGRLAIALFKGNFESELYNALYVAEQWGEHSYHRQLLDDDKGD